MGLILDQGSISGHHHRAMEIQPFRIACGEFIGVSDVGREELERPGIALVPKGVRYAKGMFVARTRGTSMQPKIKDGTWCIFHPDLGGTRENCIVLVEDQSKMSGDRYTLKKYHSEKAYSSDGTWVHEAVFLLPLNREHSPIRLSKDGNYRICGRLVGQVAEIQRVEPFQYRQL